MCAPDAMTRKRYHDGLSAGTRVQRVASKAPTASSNCPVARGPDERAISSSIGRLAKSGFVSRPIAVSSLSSRPTKRARGSTRSSTNPRPYADEPVLAHSTTVHRARTHPRNSGCTRTIEPRVPVRRARPLRIRTRTRSTSPTTVRGAMFAAAASGLNPSVSRAGPSLFFRVPLQPSPAKSREPMRDKATTVATRRPTCC